MSKLFEKLKLRDVEFRNRLWISPMCQYSSENGMPNDWHMVHLGSRAVGGAGLVMVEATAVSPEGRISLGDTGIWSDEQTQAFKPIAKFIKGQGAAVGIQLAHAGRKASTPIPWAANGKGHLTPDEGGWEVVAPSPKKFADNYALPREMTDADMKKAIDDFVSAAERAVEAGFEVIEIHAAHGYLLHQFLSPLSNERTDEYGGSLENRLRFPLQVASAVRNAVPESLPVFVRISATDWTDNGWDITQSIEFAKKLGEIGIDLIDVSSGGNVPSAKIEIGPGYQVPFAEAIKKEAKIAVAAVGMITEPSQAEEILQSGKADAILMARESLRDPYFAFRAANEIGGNVDVPVQYRAAINVQRARSA